MPPYALLFCAAAAVLGDALFGESVRLIARGVAQRQPQTFMYLRIHKETYAWGTP